MALSQKNPGSTANRTKSTGSDAKKPAPGGSLLDRMMPKSAQGTPGRSGGRSPFLSRFSGLADWFRTISSELRKVTWPSRDTVRNLTIIVIAVSTAVGAFLGAIDYMFKLLFEQLLR